MNKAAGNEGAIAGQTKKKWSDLAQYLRKA
jgi:hypothetical protein